MPQPTVLIIGAGLAGLTAATELTSRGIAPIVIDKGRAVGGRMATRQVGEARFDHGSQHFGARSTDFRRAVAEWKAAGLVSEWFSAEQPNRDGTPNLRHVVSAGMRRLPEHLATGLDVRTGITVTHLEPAVGWAAMAGPGQVAQGDAAIITAPVPQLLALLDIGRLLPASVRSDLERVSYHACLAVLATLDGPADLPAGHLSPSSGPVAWMADNQHKGVSPVPGVTIHSSPVFAADHIDADPAEWVPVLCEAARPFLGAPIKDAVGHRWRYAEPTTRFSTGAIAYRAPAPIVLAGEVFAGAKLEGAFRSGLAAADQVESML